MEDITVKADHWLRVAAMAEDSHNKIAQLAADAKANQPIIDGISLQEGARKTPRQTKSLTQQVVEGITTRKQEFEAFQNGEIKNFRVNLDTKTSGVLGSDHVTGNTMTTYAGQGAILPPHQINFRDLISSVPVQNGSYTFYREGTVTNSFAQQTELNLKPSQDYTWVENRVSCVYISAITQFSKQLSYNLNFIQNTIATQLFRDFYRKENDYFNVTVAGNATGNGTVANPSATVDAEELIGIIANQIKSGYAPSYAVVDADEWRRLATTKPNDYSIPPVFSVGADGMLRINNTQIVVAPWAQTDHVLCFDSSQILRVEGESLRVEFSMEDSDNFQRNKITARCECFENIALLRPDSVIYKDFSNS